MIRLIIKVLEFPVSGGNHSRGNRRSSKDEFFFPDI